MNEQFDRKPDSVYSKRLKAGKRRTYFFDVRATRGNDFFLTITESRKRMNDDGYDRHKIFLYKEDFNKFIKGLTETINYVKTELMPDFDFDSFNHDQDEFEMISDDSATKKPVIAPELLITPLPDVINGDENETSIAHRDIIDGAERPGFSIDPETKPAIEGKPITQSASIIEEVDKW